MDSDNRSQIGRLAKRCFSDSIVHGDCHPCLLVLKYRSIRRLSLARRLPDPVLTQHASDNTLFRYA
jgi:hypothetical protein